MSRDSPFHSPTVPNSTDKLGGEAYFSALTASRQPTYTPIGTTKIYSFFKVLRKFQKLLK
jgi:hypothetical protein